MKTLLLFFSMIFFAINCISQTKFGINIGIKYRVTPIYTNEKNINYINDRGYLLQKDKHLGGKSLVSELQYKISKFIFEYKIGIRYDLVESRFENSTVSPVKKNFLFDQSLVVKKIFYKNSKKEFYLNFGLGLNNFNSDYIYTLERFDNLGNIFYIYGNDDFKFETFCLSIEKFYKKIGFQIGIEYAYNHKFIEESNFILPTIQITYKLK